MDEAVGFLLGALALELVRELLDATSGVDQTLFTGVSRVRVAGHITDDDVILDTVDGLLALRAYR